MTEDEARAWLAARYDAARLAKLDRFVELLRAESERQSLIARSTFDAIWSRHIVDSAQLLPRAKSGDWLDIGSGGGLPGIVVAVLSDTPIVLSEPRRKRIEFLETVIAELGLTNVTTSLGKVQNLHQSFKTITARAVAPIGDIFAWSIGCVSRETRFILPRGQSWQADLEIAKRAWHGVFHVEQSLTDPVSGIVIADMVRPR